ncbi:MAG TPA: ribose 5-phosphate isomerase B [Gemmatimonadales bacterium]|nr:ribose 5-phosphate isomerase B [Gemmatimonadales bacterium]
MASGAPPVTQEERIRAMVRRVVYRAVGKTPPRTSARERRVVTEAALDGVATGGRLEIPRGALVTPLARQAAMERKVALVEAAGSRAATSQGRRPEAVRADPTAKVVALGADHGGYAFKEMLKSHLSAGGYAVLDCGTEGTESVDYPDFALAVAQLVSEGRAWRGILVDGAGVGSCITANKVPGVRAAMCYDEATAVNSRAHNDANVLTLGAGMIGPELGRQIVTRWLDTPAEGGRHARRVTKIMDIEHRFSRRR